MQDEITQTHVMLMPTKGRVDLAKHFLGKTLRLAAKKFWLVLLVTVFTTTSVYLINEIREPVYRTSFEFTLTNPLAGRFRAEFGETGLARLDDVLNDTLAGLKSAAVLKELASHPRVQNALSAENTFSILSEGALLQRLKEAVTLSSTQSVRRHRLIVEDSNPRLVHAVASVLPQIYNAQIPSKSPAKRAQTGFDKHRLRTGAHFALLAKSSNGAKLGRSFAQNGRLARTAAQRADEQKRLAGLKNEIQALELLIFAPENAILENVTSAELTAIYRAIVTTKVRLQAALQAKSMTDQESDGLRRHITSLTLKLSRQAQIQLGEKQALFAGLSSNRDLAEGTGFAKPPNFDDAVPLTADLDKGVADLSRIRPTGSALTLPETPVSPRKTRDLAFGLLGGFFLGVILASIIGFKDEKITEAKDLETEFGLPVLGLLPLTPEGAAPGGVA